MSKKVCVVVPTVRPERHREFRDGWWPLIDKHKATLVTVWDGESPHVTEQRWDDEIPHPAHVPFEPTASAIFCRFTDACRNLGFVAAAHLGADVVLTLDDDCLVPPGTDPIADHLSVLGRRVPVSWMNTAHQGAEYLRGFPYEVRAEAEVHVSHGVWTGTPDLDGETQLRLEQSGGVPDSLPYYVGPVPAEVRMPLCGMSVCVTKEFLPYLYYAPMGPDSGVDGLHRFGDIFWGYVAQDVCRAKGWAVYTGASVIRHTRASDARKNVEQERLGRAWNEFFWRGDYGTMPWLPVFGDTDQQQYVYSWMDKAAKFEKLIRSVQASA